MKEGGKERGEERKGVACIHVKCRYVSSADNCHSSMIVPYVFKCTCVYLCQYTCVHLHWSC